MPQSSIATCGRGGYAPDDLIFRTVYISNETTDEIIYFTKEDLTYICKQACNPQDSKTT
ncbi:MAG: hypothetical protein ACKPKO_28660 [Candidatus Fonsibacter sp.]